LMSRHHHLDGSEVPFGSSAQPIGCGATLMHRTGCLTCSTAHRIAARSRMHPSYCFHGASRYSPMTSPSIKERLGNVPSPCGFVPFPTHLHTGFWLAPQTRALLLPSRLDPLATGCRKPFLTSPTHPFRIATFRWTILSVRDRLRPLPGFRRYHHTLFKGNDGRRSRACG